MTKDKIDSLITDGNFPDPCGHPELIETHISWVILCNRFVYKIKKPMHYSFLDFSTLEKRKYYCEREVELNQRLTKDLYLDVVPVKEEAGRMGVGNVKGEVIDYAVRLRRMDRGKQMDVLLQKNEVSSSDVQNLARLIANFHKKATVVLNKDISDVQRKFNDLAVEKDYLRKQLGIWSDGLIDLAIDQSNGFLEENKDLLISRLKEGLFRDCHGDLHSRNIILLPEPIIFDCIEFSDDFRQIDVLNEVAFLCMDLDAFRRPDLSELFIKAYNELFPAMRNEEEKRLFIYYKTYRANVRAKVNSMRARGATDNTQQSRALAETEKYLRLMQSYLVCTVQ